MKRLSLISSLRKKRFILLLLSVAALLLLASSVGGTMASFLDQESASGNSFQAWTSTLWRQTNQTDFEAGVLNNVDITSSSGDVKLAVKSGWYDTAWSRRKPVTINNAGSSLTDYQVKVNVSYDSDMQTDFDDIRFTDTDGSTLLSYWRESYTDSDSATFWVKVPSVPSGSKTIYMYYGNSAASSTSDGTATFEFFDDFEDGSQDWTVVTGSWSESNGVLSGAKGTSSIARVKRSFSDPGNNYAYEWKQRHYDLVGEDDAACAGLQIKSPTTDYSPYDQGYACYSYPKDGTYAGGLYANWVRIFKVTGGSATRIGEARVTIEQNKWYHYKITYNGGTIKFYVDETEKISVYDTTYTTGEVIRFHAMQRNNTDRTADFDDVRIRKYAEPEPTTSVGSEEGMYVSSGTIASQVLDTEVTGASWDALFWDETVPASTDISFAVRASDTLFAKGDATPSWTSVGGTSPATSGLPPGRYMQWRATLTTSDTSKTPVLHEVRVYHY